MTDQPTKEKSASPVAESSAAPVATPPTAASPPGKASSPRNASSPGAASQSSGTEYPAGLQPPRTDVPLPEEDDADSAIGDDAVSSTASIASSILRYRTLNGRTYHHDIGDTTQYWGPNDDRQSNTLDISHHTCSLVLGGKIYLAPLPDKIEKVLDVGTGTGIWAMDFGDEHPDAEVIGTDISPIQPTWVPPNVSFQIEDFTGEWTFPASSFDYVHLRWLVGCVQDWTEMFKNAYRVLKPGGFIESMDFDGEALSDDGGIVEGTALYQWDKIYIEGGKKLGSRACFNPLAEGLQRKALEEAGFINITETHHKVPLSGWSDDPVLNEIGQFSYIALTNDIEGFVGLMATQIGWTKEEIAVYAAQLRRELKSLKYHAYLRGCTAIAQKPFDA